MMKLCNSVYWLALTIWVGLLLAAGVSAVSAFTTLRTAELDLHLGAFAAYDSEQHWRIAAGHVTEPIFTFVDFVQAPVAIIALVMLVLQLTLFRMPWRSAANLVRTLALVAATALYAGRVVFLMPQMNHELRAYWDAAGAGKIETAERHLAAFNVNHRRARPMMDATLLFLLVAVASSGAAMTRVPQPRTTGELQQPHLSRKK